MSLIDIAIVVLLVLSAVLGYQSGLIRSLFSLLGLVGGIAVASWNYERFEGDLKPLVQSKPLADAVSFCVLALAVMVASGLLGLLIMKVAHGVGLGWLDRLAGVFFGFLRGALLVTLCIVTLAAFFPDTRSLGDTQLARYFLGAAHLTTQMTPTDLKRKIIQGLHVLQKDTPAWLHPE